MKYTLLLMGILFATPLLSQVGINNTNPNATLEINASNVGTPSNEDGILIPRVDEFPLTSPGTAQDGMMVFITGNGTPTKGFYYWDNDAVSWISVNGDKNTLDEGYDEGGAGVGRIITADNGALEIQDTGGLRVEGDINAAANIIHDGDTNTFITFTPDRVQVDAGGRNYIDIQHSVTEIAFNEDSTQSDFRVESGSEEYMLFVDGSNDAVGIGQNNPQSPLHVGIETTFNLSHENTGQDGLFLIGSDDTSGNNAIGSSIGFGAPRRIGFRRAAISAVQTSGDIDHVGLAFYTHSSAVNLSDMRESMRLSHEGFLGINNSSPDATLDLVGTMQFVDGNEAAGYVLASDASGNATWTDPSGLVSDTQNTLDAAYDEGGAGAGSTITADTGAVTINGDDGFTVSGTFSSGDAINISGAGTRMFFNPRTATFRAGGVTGTEWDSGNLGNYSVAIGRENIASAAYSSAFGYQNTASADHAFATGFSNLASGLSSMAMGYDNTASGIYSVSMGRESSATGDYGISLGYDANATGNLSIALGRQANATVTYATSIGFGNTASGVSSLAMGESTIASGSYSSAFGRSTTASGNSATVLGYGNQAYSYGETVLGLFSTAYTPNSTSTFNGNDRLFVLGNGLDGSNRSNALTVFKDGEVNINDAYSLPTVDGTSGQVLTTDGAGTLSFAAIPSDIDWVDSGADIERQSGDVYIGNTNATNNDLYISDRLIDWDNSSFYVDPASTSNFNNINVDASSATTPGIQINDTNTGFFSGTAGTIGVTTNGTERMRIQDDGELSIGLTTATNYLFSLNSLSDQNQIRIGNNVNSTDNFVDITHDAQRGNGLDISMDNVYTLASRSGISVFNEVGDTQVDIAKYESGTINFYGLEVSIPVNGSGVEYGVYSDVQTSNGYAGYFIGDTYVSGQLGVNLLNPTYAIHLPNNASTALGSGEAYGWDTYSDMRVKSNKKELIYGLNEILAIQPKSYFHHTSDFKDGKLKLKKEGQNTIGFIAQELYKIIPEAANKPENENEELWSVNYDKVLPVAVKSIQELNKKVERLSEENQRLKEQLSKYESLEARLSALENNNVNDKDYTEEISIKEK